MIRAVEQQFGMTPLARLRLGLAWVNQERGLRALRGEGPPPAPEEVEVEARVSGVRNGHSPRLKVRTARRSARNGQGSHESPPVGDVPHA
jgi:hypothetical protein